MKNKFPKNQLGRIVINIENKAIYLSQGIGKEIPLNTIEIYNLLINRKGLCGISYEDILIQSDVKELKLFRSLYDISFIIEFKAEFAEVKYQLISLLNTFPIYNCDFKYILENNYLIKNNEWFPVSPESIQFAKFILTQFTEEEILPINYSLDLYSKRHLNRYIIFKNQQLNLTDIFSCKLYSGISYYFIKDLYDYQEDGLKWLKYCCFNKIGGILGDDMGLGKTAQTIALVSWIVEKNILKNILIVVPSTLIENWKREFYFFTPSLKPYIHHGNSRTGSINFLLNEDIVITSYSMVINDQYLLNKIKWGLVLIDEASLIKNPNSERKIAISDLDADVRIAMTGTPIENSLVDLWSITDFVLPGYFGSIEAFTAKFIKKNIETTLKESDLNILKDEVSFIMLRRKKEDVLDSLPEKIEIHQALQMNDHEAILYNEERESILSKLKSECSINIFTLIQKLRQYTTHPSILEDELFKTIGIKELSNVSNKFSRTIELLDEIKERKEKVIIFTEYLKMIDIFERVLKDYYKTEVFTIDGRIVISERQKKIDSFTFQDGFSIMVLNPKTAGMGLNITAANHVIHYTRQWNPALEEQASARSYRNKQIKNVNIYYLYYVNTIEEIIDLRLRAKSELSGEVISVTDSSLSFDDYLNYLSKTPITK